MSQPNVEKEAGPPAQADTPVEEAPVNEKKVREYKDFGHDEVKPTRTSRLVVSSTRLFPGLTSAHSRCQCGYVKGTTCSLFFPQMAHTYTCLTCNIMQIELKADDLYDKEKVDLETIVIEDVFARLQCNDQGLSSEEAQRRLEIFGPNKLEQEEQNPFFQVSFEFLCLGLTSEMIEACLFSF